jgi:hypothetical protein
MVKKEGETMKGMLLVCLMMSCGALFGENSIPDGTILPLELKSALNSGKSKVGEVITARVAQDVPLGAGAKIRSGTEVLGHVVAVTPAGSSSGAKLAVRFDHVASAKGGIAITTNLRALASPMEVWDAQLPQSGPDRGTPETVWTTVQVGNSDIVYRGGGPVANGSRVVGEPLMNGGVLVNVSAKPGSECRGVVAGNDRPQALWVFASDACGVYSLPNITIRHAGRTDPVGQIVLVSSSGDVKVRKGSGLLLRVDGARP